MKKLTSTFLLSLLILVCIGLSKNATAQYCTPTYTNIGGQFGIFIMKVELDSIQDSTGAIGNPYFTYNANKSTTLKKLNTYTIDIAAGTYNGGGNNVTVFIDYNGDQDYADAGEKVGQILPIGAGPTKYSITFTVPCNATAGTTRIRVRMGLNGGGNGTITNMDPCTNVGYGECQDYKLHIVENPLYVSGLDVAQPNILNVVKGSNSQEILQIKVSADGCQDTLPVTNLYLNTNGSTDTSDIGGIKVYYTGTNNQFNTTNAFDSTLLSNQFTLNGSQQLTRGDNYFWLTYDVKSGATDGDLLDGVLDSVTIHGVNYYPITSNPNGYRVIDTAMTFTSFTVAQNDSTPVVKGSRNNEMMMIQIDMSTSGGSIPLSSLSFNTNGSNNPATDITNVRVFTTGANNFFDTTILYGTLASPSGSFTVNGFTYLLPGSNYFWLTYDIATSATTDDTVDVELTSADINSASYNNSGSNKGLRVITSDYCLPTHPNCGTQFIQGFNFAGINNTSSGCTNFTGPAYSQYPASFYTTNLNKGNNYKATAYNSNAAQSFSIWIDYNHNGTFDNTEYTQMTKTNANIAANDTASATISVPCTAKSGWTKMRVRSRGVGGANGATDACTTFGSGETEDYFVFLTNQTISYVDAMTASTLDVLKGWTGQQIIKMAVVSNSCGGSVSLTKLNLSTNGSTDTIDIKAAKVYFTGNSNVFSAANLLGTVNTPGNNFSITCNQTLSTDTNWIWLTYDVDANATVGHYLDAQVLNMTIGGNTYTPNTSAPSGNRLISNYMTVNSTTVSHPSSAVVYSSSTNQQILRINYNMSSGAATSLTQIYLNTRGTTAPTTNIFNGKVWSTGSDATFTNPVQFGATTVSLNGSFTATGNLTLATGDNYMWVTYDIQANSIANDTVDAELDSTTINSVTAAPANGAPAGYRLIAKTYCTPTHTQSCAFNPSYIHGVRFNTLNNWKSGCTSNTGNKYNVYSASQFTTTVYRGNSYNFVIYNDTNSSAQAFGFWLDLNQNGTFETTEFTSVSANLAINSKDSVSYQIPCSALKGQTRLRVRSRTIGGQFTSSDACTQFGSGETEDYTITIGDNPNAGWLGNNKISCNGANVTLSAGVNFVKYLWSTGDTTSTITVNTPGKYYLTTQTMGGCIGTDTTSIIASNVTVNLGNDTIICNGGTVILDGGSGYTKYLWSNGDTTQATTLLSDGVYTLTVKNADACAATDTIELIYNYATVNLGNDTTICVGSSINLNSGNHTTYTWNTGATTQSINVTTAGQYYVSVDDAGGCTGYDTIDIAISAPALSLGNDISVCQGTKVKLDAGSWSDYNWSSGGNTQTVNPTASGDYSVIVVNQFGCVTSDTVNVLFNALPIVELGNDTVLCLGNTLNLNGGNGNTWTWNTGATTQTLAVTLAGNYKVTTTNAAGCTTVDSVKVTNSSATVSAGPDKTFCEGKSDTLFSTLGYPSYQWSNGATSWYIMPTISGNYWIKVTNIYGCTATDTAIVNVLAKPSAVFTTQYNGNQITFVPNDTTGASYLWDFGDGNLSTKKQPTYTYQGFGNYDVTLKIVGKNGCEDIQKKAVIFNAVANIKENPFSMSAYPNPFGDVLTLSYTLNKNVQMTISVLDATGRTVTTPVTRKQTAGEGTMCLDLSSLSAGFYFIQVSIDDQLYTLRVNKTNN
ncbi:MAG: T9SS type A sorting domain-containing protein [Bacteroidetes bacterium]|nr:T9SS type A sorting domain-containing protein [Bacteroidota bacterium]